MKEKKKLFVLPSYYPSILKPASGIFFQDHAKLMAEAGFETIVVNFEARSLRTLSPQAIRENNFRTSVTKPGKNLTEFKLKGWNPLSQTRWGASAWVLLTIMALRKAVRSFGIPNVIHAHNALLAGAAARIFKERFDIPFLLTEHSSRIIAGTLQKWELALARKCYLQADKVIAVSDALRQQIVKLTNNKAIPAKVPNPIDTEFFTVQSKQKAAHFTFAVVCNLVPIKRVDLAIKAFSIFAAGKNCRLTIAGGGQAEKTLREMSNCLEIGNKVEFRGPVAREGVREVLREAHCLLICSDNETFGMIGAEALSCGIPVITTECGGPQDFVTKEVGITIPPGSASALAEAMETMHNRFQEYNPSRLRKHIEAVCGKDVVMREVTQILDEVLLRKETKKSGYDSYEA